MNLKEIPIKFGVVKGNFSVTANNLSSLKNSPRVVTGKFNCSGNQNLTSLKDGPKSAKDYYCVSCDLRSLEGAPNEVESIFSCRDNGKLTSLKNGPKKVGDIDCRYCNLTSLEGAPSKVKGFFACSAQENGHKFTEEDVRAVCDASTIYV